MLSATTSWIRVGLITTQPFAFPPTHSYYPDYRNRTSIEDGVDPMGEWAVLVILDWVWRLGEKEATFRQCAYGVDAPLDCPVFSDLTTHRTLWRSQMTVGIMGFGSVGKVSVCGLDMTLPCLIAEHLHNTLVASTASRP